jgi:hypothetical protein
MQRILNIQNSCAWPRKNALGMNMQRKAVFADSFSVRQERKRKEVLSGKAGIGATAFVFCLTAGLAISGILYLYQVNTIATKGFEVKEIEQQIKEAEKESNRLKIREVELKSMYNIEKATENMNLIKATSVSYVEMAGPVAMK